MDQQPTPQPAPPIADGVDRALDPRVIPMRRTVGWITAAFVALGTFIVLLAALVTARGMPGWLRVVLPLLWLGVVLVKVWQAHWWPVLQYQHTRYRVDDQRIEIRRGVYFRVAITVPRSRVQHTDVSQGPIERRYGLVWSPPAPRNRDKIGAVRAIWDAWESEAALDYHSNTYNLTLMTPNFSPRPAGLPRIPVSLAAVGPAMLRLGGEVCDGVRLHPFSTRRYLAEVSVARIAEGLAKSGRERRNVEVIA